MGKHYLYRHIRLDQYQPFYVGIGTKPESYSKTKRSEYARAHTKAKRERSAFWHRIVNKTEYKIEILMESDDYELIKKKEIEFIALHGRRDLGKGTLCNLTDGGDGMIGLIFTDTHRSNIGKGNTGKKRSPETRLQQSLARKGVKWTEEKKESFKPYIKYGENHPLACLALSLNTGIFYHTITDAAHVYGIKTNTLKNMLSGHRRNRTDLVLAESEENGIYPIIPEIKPYVNLSENNRGAKNSRSLKTIDKHTGELYVSVKEACEATEYSYQVFKEMLHPDYSRKNDSGFEYYDPEKHVHLLKQQ